MEILPPLNTTPPSLLAASEAQTIGIVYMLQKLLRGTSMYTPNYLEFVEHYFEDILVGAPVTAIENIEYIKLSAIEIILILDYFDILLTDKEILYKMCNKEDVDNINIIISEYTGNIRPSRFMKRCLRPDKVFV